MIDVEEIADRLNLLPSELRWVSVSREFDPDIPARYLDAWIETAKRDLILEAYKSKGCVITEPDVLRERGGGGIGVRVRALVMPLIGSE